MAYGGRYLRMAAGDPGLFSGILKGAAKIAGKAVGAIGAISKVPVLGKVLTMVPGVGTAIGAAQLGGAALGALSKVKGVSGALTAARGALGGIASKVTKGPLMLGNKNLLPSRPGVGPILLAGGGTALGVAAGVSATKMLGRRKPRTQAQPAPRRRRTRARTMTRTRCGCPKGKRHVCFTSGKSNKARRGVSARQAAARRRFAAAARRGPIRKGARL